MKTLTVEKMSAVPQAGAARRRREHLFYTGMALVIVATVFAGFARTYYLRPYFDTQPLIPLLHLHGIIFTSWVALFLVQTLLVASNRTRIHRRLGVVGGVLSVLMIVVGVYTALVRAKQGAAPVGDVSPLAFLTIPFGDLLVFGSLVGAGLYFRRRLDVHKRLMLLAMIAILPAAVARLPLAIMQAGPPAFFGLTDIFIVACVVYDFIARGRPHRATLWGGLLIIASQPLRLMIGGTHAWITFADWMTRLV
ncbi:MAG: hypothetical protein ICV60_07615 [Pyrinomonadaceae bacterium]|nr:hypothetical protein [Pyrinomonadaceae bacterium]